MMTLDTNNASIPDRAYTFAQLAISYVRQMKWAVFPIHSIDSLRCTCGKENCTSPGKHPLTKNGVRDATTNFEQLVDWGRQWPYANIGAVTGKANGFFVLDVDGDAGATSLEILEQEHGKLPATVEQITGSGGRHLLFKYPQIGAIGNKVAFRPGLDIRGDGGYIVVAPSRHISGGQYVWEASSRPDEIRMSDAPKWLFEAIGETAKTRVTKTDFQSDIPEGGRNSHLCRLAGSLLRQMGEEDALEVLLAMNLARCKPPLEASEVKGIVSSVSRMAESNTAANDLAREEGLTRLRRALSELTMKPENEALRQEAIGLIARVENSIDRAQFESSLASILKPFGVGKRHIKREVDRLTQELREAGESSPSIENDITGFVQVIEGDPGLANLRYNEHTHRVEFLGTAPWTRVKPDWSEEDLASVKHYLCEEYGLWAPGVIDDALLVVATRRGYHPIRDYLNKLVWDQIPRVDTLLIDRLEAEDNAYTRAVTRKTLVAAVARVFEPGIKFDQMLVLVGGQGIGKSTLFRQLGKEWFNDSLMLSDLQDKTGCEKLVGFWILEIGELAGMRKVEAETVKNFLSRQTDVYRAAYARNAEVHRRQSILVGTTNADSGFLRDATGGRRFYPVMLHKKSTEVRLLTEAEIDQVWAEAHFLYRQGESLRLDPETAALAMAEQDRHRDADEREGIIAEFLEASIPEDWHRLSLADRKNWIHKRAEKHDWYYLQRKVPRTEISTIEVWCELFDRDRGDLNDRDSRAINNMLRNQPGWELAPKKKRLAHYGSQRIFVRVEDTEDGKKG